MIKSSVAFAILSGMAQQAALMMYRPWPVHDHVWLWAIANLLALSAAPLAFGLVVGLVTRHIFTTEGSNVDEAGSATATLAMAGFTVAAVISIGL
jgi:hypothetical protein